MSIANPFVNQTDTKTAQSLASQVTFDAIDIQNHEGFAMQLVWSAGSTPSTTASLQVSLDGINFITVGSGQTVSGASGTVYWDIPATQTAKARVILAAGSGSATFRLYFGAKRRV